MELSKSVEQLGMLRERFAEAEEASINGDENITSLLLHRTVVGLDWNGNEMENFDCAFTNSVFITFVNERRKKRIDFGLRIHAGEVTLPDQSPPEFIANITKTINALYQLYEQYVSFVSILCFPLLLFCASLTATK